MLTKIIVRNFKIFDEIELELGNRVILIGPNNSGKTSALQALALWDIGLKRWVEKRGPGKTPEKRSGVTVNRRDLISLPVPSAKLLWRDLHIREANRGEENGTQNIRIEIIVEGITSGEVWQCGLEFDYANEESFYCRPVKLSDGRRMDVPPNSIPQRIAYLPPMSGLSSSETRLDEGAINVRLGEGRTAEVLRNLCYQVSENQSDKNRWSKLVKSMRELFGITLQEPNYIPERGEITMSYQSHNGTTLDISSSGRGQQQTLLLLSHMSANPGSTLLLDEPDAHLEILRQRQIYQVITDIADQNNCQILAASHSEIILNEAANRDIVIAFVGKPHRIDDRGSQLRKSLIEIGFDQYYQAETKGWVIYLEGSTDLAMLTAFSEKLNHPVKTFLDQPFVHYVANQPQKAQSHFYGLREAKPDLVGIAIYDHLEQSLPSDSNLVQIMWEKRELENYLCQRETLLGFARSSAIHEGYGELFCAQWEEIMNQCINKVSSALKDLSKPMPWDPKIKASDEFLDPLFKNFYRELKLPNLMQKTKYHILAKYVPNDLIDPEISVKLDQILEVAKRGNPLS